MWGYPTGGRGRHIEKLLAQENFNKLIQTLESYINKKEISFDELKNDIKSIANLGLSTMTKFTHFLDIKVNGYKAVILDNQIVNVISSGKFAEFEIFKGEKDRMKIYVKYIEKIDELSLELNVKHDQVEMFLFTFGKMISEIK